MSIGFSQTFRLDLDIFASTIELYASGISITPDEVSESLGIGRRKLDGFNGWLKQMRFRDPAHRVLTNLARVIHEADPSLDSYGTLILLHYLLTSNEDAEVWYGVFNEFVEQGVSFKRESIVAFFEARGVTSSQLTSDAGNLLNMYTDVKVRALANLGVLEKRDDNYMLSNIIDIPALIMAFCLYDFRERVGREMTTSFQRLLIEKGRPGKVFALTERALRIQLQAVEQEGIITIVRSADIDGIAYTYEGQALDLLRQYYAKV